MPSDMHGLPPEAGPVRVPAEVEVVLDRLARKVHDAWARERLADGWKWGPNRDDGAKLHPSLVPYDDLPDEEKKYDRIAAEETLKALCALGFRIVAPLDPKGGR
jgi:ryanodine receptor 2